MGFVSPAAFTPNDVHRKRLVEANNLELARRRYCEDALRVIHKVAQEAYEKHRDLTYLEICAVAETALKGPPQKP